MIKTVEFKNRLANTWLVNKGEPTEFEAPMNYFELAENMKDINPLKAKYDALDAWFNTGYKAEPYKKTDKEIAEDLSKDLKEVHKEKTREVKNFVTDTELYSEKYEEYKSKERLAKEAVANSDFSIFEMDAKVRTSQKGIPTTAEQYAQLIIAKADGIVGGIGMIERNDIGLIHLGTFRTYVSALIEDEKFDTAKQVIQSVKDAEVATIVSATDDELSELLGL